MRLLIDGDRFFDRLHQAIADATNHISFEIYIFDRDDAAVAVADQLKERSRDNPGQDDPGPHGQHWGGHSPARHTDASGLHGPHLHARLPAPRIPACKPGRFLTPGFRRTIPRCC